MKKISLLITILLLVMSGCTQKKERENENSIKLVEEESVVIDGLEIQFSEVKTTDIVTQKDDERILYTFPVTGKNLSSVSKGLGATDFKLVAMDGKTYEIDHSFVIFGDSVAPGERIEGELNFSLEGKTLPEKLTYQPTDKVVKTWKIKKK